MKNTINFLKILGHRNNCRIFSCIFFLLLISFAGKVFSQENLTDSGEVQEEFQNLKENEKSKTQYYQWKNILLVQLELLLPDIANSLGRLDNKVSKIAVSEFAFDSRIEQSTRKIIRAKVYGTILYNNPSLRLIHCAKCSQVRSELKDGVLQISRGVAKKEERAKLAKELDVEAFMSATFSIKDKKLVVLIEVTDAAEGRMILSDVFTSSSPTPSWIYQNIVFGHLIFPIKFESSAVDASQVSGFFLATEFLRKFTQNAGFSYKGSLFFGANKLSQKGTDDELDVGLYGFNVEGTIFRHFNLSGNSAILSTGIGIGQGVYSVGDNLFFPTYLKADMKLIISNEFILGIETSLFQAQELTKIGSDNYKAELPGQTYGIYAGYQF